MGTGNATWSKERYEIMLISDASLFSSGEMLSVTYDLPTLFVFVIYPIFSVFVACFFRFSFLCGK